MVGTKLDRKAWDICCRYEDWSSATELFVDMADEVDRLREFATYVMADVWDHNGPDGGSVQDKAEELGLIELCPIDSEDSIDGETEHFFLSWEEP